MVRMGSPERFRRGAPPQTSSSGRVQNPTCRVTESRQPPFARDLPVRLVLSESECVAYRSHSKASLAPVDLTLEFVHGRSRWMQSPRGRDSADPVRAVAGIRGLPDHHVFVVERFAVHEVAVVGLEGRPGRNHAVVDLGVRLPANDPDIALWERPVGRLGGHAVVMAGDDLVGCAALRNRSRATGGGARRRVADRKS
jgi:hypothetical protein